MPVTLSCSGCKSTLKVRDELAGKKVKCPKCATLLTVPAAEEEEFAAVEIDKPEDSVVDAPPPDRKTRPDRDTEDEDDRPRGKARRRDDDEDEDDRPRSKSRRRDNDDDDEEKDDRKRRRDHDRDEKRSTSIRSGKDRSRRDQDDEDDDDRDRRRRRGRDRDDDDDDDDRIRKKSKYKRCPQCEAPDPEKVKWTAWGSFYGPALFSHVRCTECGYCYNGKTGRSNLIAAILFFTVPLLGILGIVGGVGYLLYSRGYFD